MKLIKKLRRFRKNVATYQRTLGTRGLLASAANLAVGHPRHMAVAAPGIKHPLFVRLRTSDPETFQDIFVDREYEYETTFSPRTIVDVGANCGLTSVFYANRYPDAMVVAVEAEPSNFEALLRNTRPYANVIPIHAALWNVDGQVEVFAGWPKTNQWGKWGFRVRNGSGCRALTLPTLMRELKIDCVDILKIDVEGAEQEIFTNCNWMDKVNLLAIELHDRFRPGCSEPVEVAARNHRKSVRGMVAFYAR